MKAPPRACVVLSDYPIKTMAYQRLFFTLGEDFVMAYRSVHDDFADLKQAKLVVCDMNIMSDLEGYTLNYLEHCFPKANILFLEEDHRDMRIQFSNQRDICRLGKLAEISLVHSTLRELLLQTSRKEGKPLRLPKERLVKA